MEARSKNKISIDSNVPLWIRGFVNVVHVFRVDHEMNQMIISSIATEAKVAENNAESQRSST